MKSSLTLVPSTDTAVQVEATAPLSDEHPASEGSELKPHLRLVGPENQADFIKEAIASKPARKPRKRKSDTDGDTTQSGAASSASTDKKPRKATARKPRAKKAVPAEQKSTDVLLPKKTVSAEQLRAFAALLDVLSQVAEHKAQALLDVIVSELGEEAPIALAEAFEGPADPRIITEFSASVDELLNDLAEQPDPAIAVSNDEVEAKPEPIPLRVLGPMIVSQDNDPFEPTEWTLFEEHFTSRWYDSKTEAMDGLQTLMTTAGLNFACETKLVSRYFSLRDYVYKRYSITAVVGVYADYTESADQEQCRTENAKIDHVIVPEAQIAFDKAQALHRAERKAQMKPEGRGYDHFLKLFPVVCYVALVLGLLNVALKTGFFS